MLNKTSLTVPHPRVCVAVTLVTMLSCALNLAFAGSAAETQRRDALPVEVLLGSRVIVGSVSLTEDGQLLAYTLRDSKRSTAVDEKHPRLFSDSGVPLGATGTDIWLTNTKSGESRNLTEGNGSNWGAVWSPDSNQLAFYSDRDGIERLWVYDKALNNVRRLSEAVVRPYFVLSEVPQWTKDSKHVLVKVLPEGAPVQEIQDLVRSPAAGEAGSAKKQLKSTVILYRAALRAPQDAWTKAEFADLALIDLEDGRVERIARNVNPVWYGVSPDSSQIAFATIKGQVDGSNWQNLFDVVVISASGKTRTVAKDVRQRAPSMAISWSPDGRWLSYTDSGKGTLGDCYLVSTFDGVVSKATGLLHPDFNVDATRPPVWDAMGKALYFIVSYSELWRITIASGSVQRLAVIPGHKMLEIVAPFPRGRFRTDHDGRTLTVATLNDATKESGFYRIDLVTGEHQRVVEENKAYGPNQYLNTVSPALGNLFAFVAQDSEHPPDYWILERDKTTPQRLTHINPEIDRYALGRSKLIEWNSIDGQRLHGVLLLPPGYKPGNTYPMVVWVYGGAELSGNANVFGGSQIEFGAIDNMQLLASRGYAVLFPDAPLGIGSPLRDLACTVLPGVDKAIELGVADPDRIGVMGESLGGYSTLALIVQTPRFKAAIMRAGWGNQVSAYGAMGEDGSSFTLGILENGTGRMGGTPWQYRDRYIENSPVFYLDRVETPLFIVHGSNDTNVLPFLAGEVYIGLQRLGKEVVYAKYAGEGHDISMYANQVDYCNRMIAWFDEHLKNAGFEQKPSEANGSAVIRERQKTQSY